jgi:hypothetical protein
VGLQTIHPDVLAAAGRRWDRERWLRGVRELADAGVRIVVGLIAGLPGDTLARFSESLDFVRREAPNAEIQVFPLALLPGTELRARAEGLGIRALPLPPYTVVETPCLPAGELAACFDLFEEVTGRELDALGNPPLSGDWNGARVGAPYLSGVHIDAARSSPQWVDVVAPRAARNLTIWLSGWRQGLTEEIGRLSRRLHHGVLTLVLDDKPGWPPARLTRLLSEAGTGDHYLDRYFRHLYGPSAVVVPRLVALAGDGDPAAAPEWLEEIGRRADVVWTLDAGPGWMERATARAREAETVLVRGDADDADLAVLFEELGEAACSVLFASPAAQAAWERLAGSQVLRAREHRISFS